MCQVLLPFPVTWIRSRGDRSRGERPVAGKSAGCPALYAGRKIDPVIISTLPGSPALCLPAVGRDGELHCPMTEQHKITRAATTIGTGTLLSRILGFLRDMVIANFFGAGMAADAFFVAFRLPNLWRRLVGEGSMTISFIPVYTEYLTQRSEEESRELTHIAFTLAGTLLAILTILGVVFAPLLVRIIAPGWVRKSPETFQLTVTS